MPENKSLSSVPTDIPKKQPRKRKLTGIRKFFAWEPPVWLVKVVIVLLTPGLLWLVTFLLVGKQGLPGGQIFALLVILFAGISAGYILERIKLPPLLGMLIVGIIIRNVPKVSYGKDLKENVSSPLRQIALVVILIRAGLGLDPDALRKLSGVVLRLAFSPCLVEATVLAILSCTMLGLPWAWGFMLGFVIAAVSPAVIVPCLLRLRDMGYGIKKGIPTIVIAAASADDIVAISAFGVALGFAFSQNESLAMSILRGPIEVVLGLTFGVLWGLILGIFFGTSENDDRKAVILRFIFTLGGGCLSLFGFQYVEFAGSGALGCLSSAFVAAIIWRYKGVLIDGDNLNWAFEKLWFIVQPILFGLIGCEIDLYNLDTNALVLGLLCLSIALICRIATSFLVVAGAGLTIKERVFIAIAWLPKATVQAAIGPLAYDLAKTLNAGPARDQAEKWGLEVLTIAVLAILITAPLGAIAIMIGGPRLLTKDPVSVGGEDSESKTLPSTNNSEGSTLDSSQQGGESVRVEAQVGADDREFTKPLPQDVSSGAPSSNTGKPGGGSGSGDGTV